MPLYPAAALADDLGIDPDDLAVITAWLGHRDPLTAEECEDVRVLLDDRQARSVPEFYGLAELGWRNHDGEL